MACKSETKTQFPDEKEKSEFMEAFKLFDKDSDGKITKEELKHVRYLE